MIEIDSCSNCICGPTKCVGVYMEPLALRCSCYKRKEKMEEIKDSIKINVPVGKRAIYDEKTSTINFVNIDPSKSLSWDEFCKNHPDLIGEWYYSTAKGGIVMMENSYGLKREVEPQLLDNKNDANAVIAYIKLIRIHDEWVGDWDWKGKHTTVSHFDIIHNSSTDYFSIQERTTLINRLCFPTYQMARDFIYHFEDLLMQAKPVL